MQYIRAGKIHAEAAAVLASLLWPGPSLEQRIQELSAVIGREDSTVFLCLDGSKAVGFAQLSLRHDYVEGTDSSPVGYLEGIYVLDEYRRKGVARALVRLGELWAREKGCSQMASDCELTNADSLCFHLGSGFAEANRIICFVKDINIQEPGAEND